MKTRVLLVGAVVLASLLFFTPPAHASSTLFYDDFSGQGFPSKWSGIGINGQSNFIDQGNVSQIDNWMVVKVPNIVGISSAVTSLIANQTQTPVLGPNTVDGQVIYMAWRVQPFNITGNNIQSPSGATLQPSR